MLKPRKRLTKRQIKEDKFVTFTLKAQDYLVENSRKILSAAGVVVALIVAVFIYSQKQATKEENAVVDLKKAKINYFAKNYDSAINILKNQVDNFGGTKSSKEGTFFLASAYYETRNYVQAENYFRQFLKSGDDPILKVSAMAGVAACLEERKNYNEAAKMYREAAEKYSNSFSAPQNLYDAARCYVLAEQKDKAREVLNKLIADYSSSNIKNNAEVLLAELFS